MNNRKEIIEHFIKWFIREQNDDYEQEDIMLDSLGRYLNKQTEEL